MRFLILICDFLCCQTWRYWANIVLSIIVGFTCFLRQFDRLEPADFLEVLGILLGFTISLLAILISCDNDNIRRSKAYQPDPQKPPLYMRVITDVSYTIMVQIAGLLLVLLLTDHLACECRYKVFVATVMGMIAHVFFMMVHIVMDMYFIVTARRDEPVP